MVEKRDHTQGSRQACQTKLWHCVETSFEHLLPRAFGRDPCHREKGRGDVVVHGAVTPIDQANNPVGSADSPRKTELEKKTGTLDIVVVGLSVGVIASVSTLARIEIDGLPVRSSRGGRCIGLGARDNRGSHLLGLLRLGR